MSADQEQVRAAEALRSATKALEAVVRDRSLLQGLTVEERTRLLAAAGGVFNPSVVERRRGVKNERKRQKARRTQHDERLRADTGIRALRERPVFTTPNYSRPAVAPAARCEAEALYCYVCKQRYAQVHHFYDQMCVPCGDFNFAKRSETADLEGRVALLTGGRVKIGYQAGVKLLQAGAHLIVTTRFPRDAAARYAQEPGFGEWEGRLEIYGLDLRHTPAVESFCTHLLDAHDRLDFLVSNACQTVRRPPAFYRHMLEAERAADTDELRHLLGHYDGPRRPELLPARARTAVASAAELSQVALLPGDDGSCELFPDGRLDQDRQQVDLRERNSWRLLLDEVSLVELVETQLVNAVAPFVLNARLKPLLLRTPERDKHIVNVSAVEGQFYRRHKTTRHPHTNMAKAALNMMTRTSAADYFNGGIHMNSVDTGWVTDEDPVHVAERKAVEHRFSPPLDIVDGAARIVDPIIDGHNTGTHVWGQFLKDYKPTDW